MSAAASSPAPGPGDGQVWGPGHTMPGHHPLTNECGSSLVSGAGEDGWAAAGLLHGNLAGGCCWLAGLGWPVSAGRWRAAGRTGRQHHHHQHQPPASSIVLWWRAGPAAASTAQPSRINY